MRCPELMSKYVRSPEHQKTPIVVATRAMCQKVRRSRGLRPKMSTLLTPPSDQPYMFCATMKWLVKAAEP